MIPTTLRFGLMLNDLDLQHWHLRCLERLEGDGQIELDCLLLHGGLHDDRGQTLPRPVLSLRRRFLFRQYLRRVARPQAVRTADCGNRYRDVPRLVLRTQKAGAYSERVFPHDVALVLERRLDFLLRFGFDVLTGDILEAARHGIWSFHHGDEREYRGLPPAFWELFEGRRAVGAILQRLEPRLDAGVVLRRGSFAADPLSYGRTLNRVLYGSVGWPHQVCRELLAGAPAGGSRSRTTAPIRRAPSALQMLRFGAKTAARRVHRFLRHYLVRPRWELMWLPRRLDDLLEDGTADGVLVRRATTRYFYADPCAHAKDNEVHLFYEEYDFRRARGRIVCDRWAGGRLQRLGVPFPDLDAVHASFPRVFEHDGNVYATLETHHLRQVRLYRAEAYPLRWSLVARLLPGVAALDPSLFHHRDRWWLACTEAEDGPDHQLKLFWSRKLEGPYRPHRLNPVRSDLGASRPAGLWQPRGEALLRPAQDCRREYGGAVRFYRVTHLDPDRFVEEPAGVLEAERFQRGARGLHTVTEIADGTFIDLKGYRITPREILHALRLGRYRRSLPEEGA